MLRLFASVLFVSYLLAPLPTFAQRPVTVAGKVYFGDEFHVASGVTVQLLTQAHDLLGTETTNDTGEFRFTGLKRAVYTIVIDSTGYETINLNIDLSMASDKGLAIYLKPISKKQTSPNNSKSVSVHELSMPARARELADSGVKKLYQQKNAQAALSDFQQALFLAPAYYEAECQLAMTQLTLGRRAEAEASFRKALELSSNKYAEAHIGLGAVLLDDGNFSEAEKSIRQGLQLNPNLWLGHYELGRALMLQKHLPDALDSAEQARLLAPSVPIIYRLLSNIHLAQNDYPALIADLDTYLALDPDSPAGLRAKQLRDQIQQKLPPQHVSPASSSP
jgi:Tetratricopeptide repeat